VKKAKERMKQSKFPKGWDEEKVHKVLRHYEKQTEEEALAEDEAAYEDRTQTTIDRSTGQCYHSKHKISR